MSDFEKCINCTAETGRYPGCQDHCEYGVKAKREHEAKMKKIRKARAADEMINNTVVRLCEKRRREYNA